MFHVDRVIGQFRANDSLDHCCEGKGCFLRFSFFSSFSYRYFLLFYSFLYRASYVSHNRLFFYFILFFFYFFQFYLKHFLVFFSLCVRLNWQLACQFFSANRISYRIVLNTWTTRNLYQNTIGPQSCILSSLPTTDFSYSNFFIFYVNLGNTKYNAKANGASGHCNTNNVNTKRPVT